MRIAAIYLICIVMALCAWYCHRQDLTDLKQSVQAYQRHNLPPEDQP